LKELIVAIQRGAVLATGCRACGSPFFSNIDLTGGSTRGAMKALRVSSFEVGQGLGKAIEGV